MLDQLNVKIIKSLKGSEPEESKLKWANAYGKNFTILCPTKTDVRKIIWIK